MKMKNMFIPTLRDVPKETETKGYELLLRAGLMRKTAPGVYIMLPFGKAASDKLRSLIYREFEKSGVQNLDLIMSSSDRSDEELLLETVKGEIRSYKKLPQRYICEGIYKNRHEPANGLERSEWFRSIETIALDKDEEAMETSVGIMKDSMENIFRCSGLDVCTAETEDEIHFIIQDETAQTEICMSDDGKKCYLKEMAPVGLTYDDEEILMGEMELVTTPHCITIDDVSEFLSVSPSHCGKAVDLMAGDQPVLVIIPGDRELSTEKLAAYLNVDPEDIRMMMDYEITEKLRSFPGFTGPSGNKRGVRIVLDERITKMKNLVIGADVDNSHFINANYGRDFSGEVVADLLTVEEGDTEESTGRPYVFTYGIDIGEIRKSGTQISEKCEGTFLDVNGKEKNFLTSGSVINLSAYLQSVLQKQNDEKGIIWNENAAPFDVMITIVNIKSKEQSDLAESMYEELKKAGLKVLLDDRDERAGVKFNDRDLLGIPVRITAGKGASEGRVEFSERSVMENQDLTAEEVMSRLLKK